MDYPFVNYMQHLLQLKVDLLGTKVTSHLFVMTKGYVESSSRPLTYDGQKGDFSTEWAIHETNPTCFSHAFQGFQDGKYS